MTNTACCRFHGGGPVDFFLGGDGVTANLCPQFQPVWFGLLGFSTVSPAVVPPPDASSFFFVLVRSHPQQVLGSLICCFTFFPNCSHVFVK